MIRERQLEIAVLHVAKQAPREPVVVERPRREQLGAAFGIVLEAAKRLERVDVRQRVANRKVTWLGRPAELHVTAGAGCLGEPAVGAGGRVERPAFGGVGPDGIGFAQELRLEPGARRFVEGLAGRGGERQALSGVVERLRPGAAVAGDERGDRPVRLQHDDGMPRRHRRLERLLRDGHEARLGVRAGQQAFLERSDVEDVVAGGRLFAGVALRAGEPIELTENRQRLVHACQAKRDDPERSQAVALEAVLSRGEDRPLRLLQEPIGDPEIASRLLDVGTPRASRLLL